MIKIKLSTSPVWMYHNDKNHTNSNNDKTRTYIFLEESVWRKTRVVAFYHLPKKKHIRELESFVKTRSLFNRYYTDDMLPNEDTIVFNCFQSSSSSLLPSICENRITLFTRALLMVTECKNYLWFLSKTTILMLPVILQPLSKLPGFIIKQICQVLLLVGPNKLM